MYPEVPVIVVHDHLPSAESDQSSWRDAFSSKIRGHHIVLLVSVSVVAVHTKVSVASGSVSVASEPIAAGAVIVIELVPFPVCSNNAIFQGAELFHLNLTVPVHFL